MNTPFCEEISEYNDRTLISSNFPKLREINFLTLAVKTYAIRLSYSPK